MSGIGGTEMRNFTGKDITKIVIAKIIDKEDVYEIIHVYGNNEGFYYICLHFSQTPALFTKKIINQYLPRHKENLPPVYTCEITHTSSVMTREEAINRILNTTDKGESYETKIQISRYIRAT